MEQTCNLRFDRRIPVTAPQVGLEFSGHILAVLPAIIIGIAAGCLAVVFTVVNLKVARLREVRGGQHACIASLRLGSVLMHKRS